MYLDRLVYYCLYSKITNTLVNLNSDRNRATVINYETVRHPKIQAKPMDGGSTHGERFNAPYCLIINCYRRGLSCLINTVTIVSLLLAISYRQDDGPSVSRGLPNYH